MADCRRFQDDLKAYCDQELSWPRRLLLRRHLAECAACRQEMNDMTQVAEELRASENADAPLDAALRDKILAEAATTHKPIGLREAFAADPPVRRRFPRPLELAGAMLIVLVVAANFSPMFSTSREKTRYISTDTSLKALPLLPMHHASRSGNISVGRDGGYPGGGYPGGGSIRANGKQRFYNRTAASSAVSSFPVATIHAPAVPLPRMESPIMTNVMAPSDSGLTTRQVHNEATIGVMVNDPEGQSDQVASMATDVGGYVAENDLTTGDDGTKTAELTVNVPVAEFSDVLARIAKLGVVQSKSITGEDITDKTSDAQQAESVMEQEMSGEEAHLAKLGKHAKWQDEENMRDVRVELAQSRARLVLLRKLGRLSSIDVTLTGHPAPLPPVPTGGFLKTLSDTTHSAMQSLTASLASVLALLIWLFAYAPIWIPLLLVARYVQKRYGPGAVVVRR